MSNIARMPKQSNYNRSKMAKDSQCVAKKLLSLSNRRTTVGEKLSFELEDSVDEWRVEY